MKDALLVILLLTAYIFISYLLVRFISRRIAGINPYLRILLLSFLYALFWGIGIAASGGDPGIGLPAPNLVAIVVMALIGFYQGIWAGIIFLGFWWTIIFLVMMAIFIIKSRKQN